MKSSRKITYTALAAAIAAICIILSRFLPIRIMPLMAASLCFYIAFLCGFGYGLAAMVASMLISLFWGGIDFTLVLTLFLFAPYSIVAFFLKALKYSNPISSLIRASSVVILFNICLLFIVFVFFDVVGNAFLGIDVNDIIAKLHSPVVVYIIVSVIGSALMIGFDIMFVMADQLITKKLKLFK